MTKIDKIDIENIKLITEKTEIGPISKVRIKKGDYEIEISSESVNIQRPISEVTEKIPKKKSENKIINEEINDENIVKSPMVGVAYLSADPDSSVYVKTGQHVKAGDTLLLIEAMKTFNEIKAPKSGVIKQIIVLNSQPVEYGDHLIIFE
jgi:acetyl-CoA carboxylase biotin carboxyl carrier protein